MPLVTATIVVRRGTHYHTVAVTAQLVLVGGEPWVTHFSSPEPLNVFDVTAAITALTKAAEPIPVTVVAGMRVES